MAEEETHTFSLTLERLSGFEFNVRFDGLSVPDLLLDEPSPVGHDAGPNASRLLAAAVANCLSASLLFCLSKSRIDAGSLRANVTGHMGRNAQGRLRVQKIDVQIALGTEIPDALRLKRCLDIFEDYCVVTGSVRQGIPVHVQVLSPTGEPLLDHSA